MKKDADVELYFKKLEDIKQDKVYYCYRDVNREYTAGVFTGLKNRDIVEEFFLKAGIEIVKDIQEQNGVYPLGYSNTPSFGLGSFCASDLNISNTCPIVLWWGNVVKQGNKLDSWYPLLPRRTNGSEVNPFKENYFTNNKEDDCDIAFNICPDCGCDIKISNEGSNGYCTDCSENH